MRLHRVQMITVSDSTKLNFEILKSCYSQRNEEIILQVSYNRFELGTVDQDSSPYRANPSTVRHHSIHSTPLYLVEATQVRITFYATPSGFHHHCFPLSKACL